MEEIRRAARAYYENLSDEELRNARSSFFEMDKSGDGGIDRHEYLEYLNKGDNPVLRRLFITLDMDGDGYLDFNETFVLFYIMQSGRALFCKSCSEFMEDVYFCCYQCFFNKDDSDSTYEICCDCYGGKKFRHNDGHIFCDNYTLLSRSRSVVQKAPIEKRTKVLNIIKKGLQVPSNSEAFESLTSLRHRRQPSFTILQIEDDKNNNQRAHNEPADGLNQKDLLRKIFYAMNLLLEIATAVLDYVSSQQRQPRYALSSMILSITVMAISLIQLAYTGRKEEVSWQWKGWIPWFYHPDPSNKLFGNPVQIVELFFSVSQCVFAIIAYHYLSRDQNNPTQFSVYPIVFAFFLLCLSFRRREPRVKVSEKI